MVVCVDGGGAEWADGRQLVLMKSLGNGFFSGVTSRDDRSLTDLFSSTRGDILLVTDETLT